MGILCSEGGSFPALAKQLGTALFPTAGAELLSYTAGLEPSVAPLTGLERKVALGHEWGSLNSHVERVKKRPAGESLQAQCESPDLDRRSRHFNRAKRRSFVITVDVRLDHC